MSDARRTRGESMTMDERVEIAARGYYEWAVLNEGEESRWDEPGQHQSFARARAEVMIAALEAAGWEIVKRRENHGPVYPLIIDAPAVEEPGAGFACRLCGCSFTTEALRSMHEVNTCVHDRPAPAGTVCPTCEGKQMVWVQTGRTNTCVEGPQTWWQRKPCPTCSPNETSEQ